MKKSNYILIAIFTLVVASILTFFITGKQYENEEGSCYGIENIDIPLGDFKVIVVEDSISVNFQSGEQNQLSVRLNNKQALGEAFHAGNDTLYIKIRVVYFVDVFCKQADVSIVVQKGSRIDIQNCQMNQLTVETRGGYIDLRDNTFDVLRIQAIDCKGIGLYNNHAGFVSAEMENIGDFSFFNNHFDSVEIGITK